jgi:hypothetical protein
MNLENAALLALPAFERRTYGQRSGAKKRARLNGLHTHLAFLSRSERSRS